MSQTFQILDDFEMRALIMDGDDSWIPKSLELRVWGAYQFLSVDLVDGTTGRGRYSVFIHFENGKPEIVVKQLIGEEGRDEGDELAKVVCE